MTTKTLILHSIAITLGALPLVGQTAAQWFAKGEALEKSGNTPQALACFLEAEKVDPRDSKTLVKVAKQWGDYMTELSNESQRRDAAQKSLAYSRKALALAPKESDAHLSVALSLGKYLEFLDNKSKLSASREIKSEAEKALALDAKSDYAHHLLGRWHQNVAGMSGATRAIAKVIYGEVPTGSYQEALNHFASARRLRPDRLLHQIEYGRTLVLMGQKERGKAEIRRGLAMPSLEKDDPETKKRGQEML